MDEAAVQVKREIADGGVVVKRGSKQNLLSGGFSIKPLTE
jgi:hypothetical protein